MSSIECVREYRQTLYKKTEYLIGNDHAVSEFGAALEWSDLEYVPTWLLWEESQITNLVMTAGAIFLLPSIRLWIDAKKIQEVRGILGDRLFDFILKTTKIDNHQIKPLNLGNIKESLLSAGSAVIVSSCSMSVRPWVINVIPNPKGKLESKLANEILKHTIFVINQYPLNRE